MSAPAIPADFPANIPAESVHGHTILRWLIEAPMSSAALHERVEQAFGHAAQFHTCDRNGLALDALVALLAERGKIASAQGEWTADPSKMCGDEH